MLYRHGFHTRALCGLYAARKKAPVEKRGLEVGIRAGGGEEGSFSQMPEGSESLSEVALADVHRGLLSDVLVVGKQPVVGTQAAPIT